MRISLLAPTSAAAFRGETDVTVGGAERQLVALADALVARGHRVDVIVDEGESSPPESSGGARVWPRFRRRGLPVLKAFHPKLSSVHAFLEEVGSDCLLQRGAADLTGIGRLASRSLGIPFIFSVASESDLRPGREIVPHPQDRILYRLGAAGADLRVVQTREQEMHARRLFGGEVIRIPSFLGRKNWEALGEIGEETILWGANLRPVKRPEWLLALADNLPQLRFRVFGGAAAGHERYGERMAAEIERRSNIDYLGRVPQERLPEIFASCTLLLNTSSMEGFPNTFLEAWGHGLEIVASVDPDELFSSGRLGRFGSTIGQLRAGIESVIATPSDLRHRKRSEARAYLESEHGMGNVVDQWEAALATVV